MPELPEVEQVRRTLEPTLAGRRVVSVRVARWDVVEGGKERGLLAGALVQTLTRHGKQLAMLAHDGRAVVVHLGMTGRLVVRAVRDGAGAGGAHEHVVWRLDRRDGVDEELVFADPRRFGGVWCGTRASLAERWSRLGVDGIELDASALAAALAGRRAAIKPLLLDQSLVAGVGNIYADEALFEAGIRPMRRASTLSGAEINRLAAAIRRVLRASIEAGGSSVRDYVDGRGEAGMFQQSHRVYGRSGLACVRCGAALRSGVVGQRTTVWCAACQPGRGRRDARAVC